jgi:hypothetical protein
MAYGFDQIFAADPANPANIAQNASIKIFAPGDAAKTAIAITDTSGTPLPNPIPVNANGFGPAFMASIDRVAWEGGGFTGFFTSYEGMKNEAVAARTAAEAAQSTASTAATDALATVNASLNTAVSSASTSADAATAAQTAAAAASAAATASAAAAANAANGTAIQPDANNAGLYFIVAGGQISSDTANPGFYLIGS